MPEAVKASASANESAGGCVMGQKGAAIAARAGLGGREIAALGSGDVEEPLFVGMGVTHKSNNT